MKQYDIDSIKSINSNFFIDIYLLAGAKIAKNIPITTANQAFWNNLQSTYNTHQFNIRVFGANGTGRIEKRDLNGLVTLNAQQNVPSTALNGLQNMPQNTFGDYSTSNPSRNLYQERIDELKNRLKQAEKECEEYKQKSHSQAYEIIDLKAQISTNDLRTNLEKQMLMAEQKGGLSGLSDKLGGVIDKLIENPEILSYFGNRGGAVSLEQPQASGNPEIEFLLAGLDDEAREQVLFCVRILCSNPTALQAFYQHYNNTINVQANTQNNESTPNPLHNVN